jgi:hypothetical protein
MDKPGDVHMRVSDRVGCRVEDVPLIRELAEDAEPGEDRPTPATAAAGLPVRDSETLCTRLDRQSRTRPLSSA